MDNSTYYYCCRCHQLEHYSEALKIFASGFMRRDRMDYRVGYCLSSEFLVEASAAIETKTSKEEG
ncbi:hypothetical protein ACVNS2_21150 [Paenibacillus caseinilyticus]|uniref:Uncharacterized protein n=1 Tax=Paenibacillus mucilaginosus K02 TaxID=997761 RepID=I0BLC3_9BACL|nr:hypothetical protein [Paenibacillus mucilaginosus]AFH63170.1 hypothetical protein B2K_21105 [Paenibacillus mucilaginosus K02]